MATRKGSAANTSGDDQNDADVSGLATGVSADTPAIPDAPPAIDANPDPIPDPIVAVDADGVEQPMSGGSFIRLENGTLIRNPEA